jgi:hypothetical protein
LEKKTEFEVVPLADILQKARPVEEVEPAEHRFGAPPPTKGALIENAPFEISKRGRN